MPTPDSHVLTTAQAARLTALSGLPAELVAGVELAAVRARHGNAVPDPTWLLFRKLTGRLVRTDSMTGRVDGVPDAIVSVEATSSDLVSYFPAAGRWGFLLPYRCRRDVIATAHTDERGRFEAWVPRFDLEYVWRWRERYYGFRDVFARPPAGARPERTEPFPAGYRADLVRSAAATALGMSVAHLAELDPSCFVGPFRRAADLSAAQWGRLTSVPDLAVRATGEPAGAGFDIAWTRGEPGPLTVAMQAGTRARLVS